MILRVLGLAGLVAVTGCAAAPDRTERSFVFFDRTITHTGKRRLYKDWDFITGLRPEKGVPKNWRTPHVDYAEGTYRLRVEVLEMKETEKPVGFAFGWVNSPKAEDASIRHNHTRPSNILFKKPGVYEHTGRIGRGKNIPDMWYGTAEGSYASEHWVWNPAWDRLYTHVVPHGQDPFPIKIVVTVRIVRAGPS